MTNKQTILKMLQRKNGVTIDEAVYKTGCSKPWAEEVIYKFRTDSKRRKCGASGEMRTASLMA